jgi:hypothetical protein
MPLGCRNGPHPPGDRTSAKMARTATFESRGYWYDLSYRFLVQSCPVFPYFVPAFHASSLFILNLMLMMIDGYLYLGIQSSESFLRSLIRLSRCPQLPAWVSFGRSLIKILACIGIVAMPRTLIKAGIGCAVDNPVTGYIMPHMGGPVGNGHGG